MSDPSARKKPNVKKDTGANRVRATPDKKRRNGIRAVKATDRTEADSVLVKYTEAAAAERLANYLQDEYCYSPGLGWMQWNGQHWESVSEEVVVEVGRKRHRSWYSRALGDAVMADVGEAPLLKRLLSRGGLTAVTSLCRGLLLVDSGKFDSHTYLLNTPTGPVDLRNGELLEHDPTLYMTKVTAVGYVPGARHKDWDAVLGAVRPDARNWLQLRMGNALTGRPPHDDGVIFMRGGGENGKSTFLGAFSGLLGSYYRLMSDKVLLSDPRAHNTEMTEFRGVRVAAIEEMPEGRRLDAVRLKKATGEEITARRMKQDDMTFETTHALLVTSNYNTAVAETDWGTWRRLFLLKFPYTYVKGKRRLGPDEKRGDAGLRERTRHDEQIQEAALAWAVEGAVEWYENGQKLPQLSGSVKHDTESWRADSDLMFKYCTEQLRPDPECHIRSSEFADALNFWLKSEGHQAWSAKTIKARFTTHQYFTEHRVESKYVKKSRPGLSTLGLGEPPSTGYQAFLGLRFADEEEIEEQAFDQEG